MSGDGSFGYRYLNTSHYLSCHIYDDGISDDESLTMSAGDGRIGYRYQDTSHYSSLNSGFYHSYD